jgi:hypothetical protein
MHTVTLEATDQPRVVAQFGFCAASLLPLSFSMTISQLKAGELPEMRKHCRIWE